MDLWDGVKKGLSTFAPIIANAVVPGSGGMVGGLLSSVLGCEESPEAITTALYNATPEQRAKILEIQNSHKERLLELGSENEKLYLDDKKDARKRDVKLKQVGYKNYRADLMIFVAFCSFVFICYLINTNLELKPEVLAIFNMAIGALLKMIGDAFSFEFGSSRGSKEKDSR